MCRLFVIVARDEPVAVILRRGPSRWYHVIQWNMRNDTFVHGAWIKGRIYEEKCDISPDGRLFVYFIHQGSRSRTRFTHAWTAVSRVPWLTALVVWPQGMTHGGGGRFLDNRRLAVSGDRHFVPDSDAPLRLLEFGAQWPAESLAADVRIAEADWSGLDGQGHAIFTRGGQLFRRRSVRREPDDDVLLADFTELKPDPQPAPEWATRPL